MMSFGRTERERWPMYEYRLIAWLSFGIRRRRVERELVAPVQDICLLPHLLSRAPNACHVDG